MKKIIIKMIALCLVLLMAIPLVCACSKDETDDTPGADGNESESNALDVDMESSSDTTSERDKYIPERIDYNNTDFVIAHHLSGGYENFITYVDSANLKADAVNQAFYVRNKQLESYFNVNVVVHYHKDMDNGGLKDGILVELEAASMSQQPFADVAYSIAVAYMSSAIVNGYVADINKLPGLNLGASYYDQRIQEEYCVEGKLFALEGDFSIYDEMRTMVVAINRAIYDEYHFDTTYGSPYELVDGGNWTLDTMLEMAKITGPLKDNLNKDSTWGIITESQLPYTVYLGTGNKIIEVNDGNLNCTLADPVKNANTVEILGNCVDKVLKNSEVAILIADKDSRVEGFGGAQRMFVNGQALFRTSTLSDVTKYQDMEDVFGILPIPKYSVDQPEYYSWCSSTSHAPLLVPRGAELTAERTGSLIEGMAYFSKYMPGTKMTLVDAFYENMMNAKLCNSAEDRKMLELIFANKTYDIDYTLDLSATGWKITTFAGTDDYSVPQTMQTYTEKMTAIGDANPLTKLLTKMWECYPNN